MLLPRRLQHSEASISFPNVKLSLVTGWGPHFILLFDLFDNLLYICFNHLIVQEDGGLQTVHCCVWLVRISWGTGLQGGNSDSVRMVMSCESFDNLSLWVSVFYRSKWGQNHDDFVGCW